jgi:hypothetical protein
MAALYGGRALSYTDDPYQAIPRPWPLGRGPAHDKAIIRDQASAWRDGGPQLPAGPDPYLADLREEFHAPRTYWWEQREGRD